MHFCGEKSIKEREYYSSVVRNGTNKLLLKVCIYTHIQFKPEDDDDDDSDDDEDNEQ